LFILVRNVEYQLPSFVTFYGTYRVIFLLFYPYLSTFWSLTSYNSVFPYSSHFILFISFEALSFFFHLNCTRSKSIHAFRSYSCFTGGTRVAEIQFGTSRCVAMAPGPSCQSRLRVTMKIRPGLLFHGGSQALYLSCTPSFCPENFVLIFLETWDSALSPAVFHMFQRAPVSDILLPKSRALGASPSKEYLSLNNSDICPFFGLWGHVSPRKNSAP